MSTRAAVPGSARHRAALRAGLVAALLLGPAAAWAQEPVEAYKRRFATITPAVAEDLGSLYAEDVHFQDPITQVNGLPALEAYLGEFVAYAEGASFQVDHELVGDAEAVLFWTMRLPGRDGDPGRSFAGVSHLRFRDGRIQRQRDYFDLGEAAYEQVPVLGWVLRRVKARLH